MIDIRNLTKTYGEKKAVDNLSLRIGAGEMYAFIGHNGAGKTTTIKSICGLLDFDSGEIFVDGVSIKEIQIWLGHSNYSTTANIYAHLDVAAKQNAAESIANSLSVRDVSKSQKKKSVGRRSA